MITFFRRHPYWLICAVAVLCVAFYWLFWATDRYVSQASVVVQSAQGTSISAFNLTSLLSGGSADQLLKLREYLRSTDVLKKLNAALDLRSHYSNEGIDVLSRLESPHVPMGQFHEYFLERVTIKLDEYSHVLDIKAEAFDPETAHAIVVMLLRAGETHMNKLTQQMAEQQIQFIKEKVAGLRQRVQQARETFLAYQKEHGLISPTGAVETLSTVVATLQGEIAKRKAQRRALAETYSQNSPAIQQLNREISGLRKEIEDLRGRMAASTGDALNRKSVRYITLKKKLEFAREMYTNALAALQSTRVQAASSLKKVLTQQSPTTPEYSNAPDRLYNIVVFVIVAVLAALIVHLLAAIIRDHRD